MQHPSSGTNVRRRGRRGPIAGFSALVLVATVVACSSSDDFVTFGGGSTEDSGSSPSFVSDAGSEGSAIVPPPETALCSSTECPDPFRTCPSVSGAVPPYPCGTNTAEDPDHCGGCGIKCPIGSTPYHFQRACVNGQCQPFCVAGWADCNGLPDDGCESNPKVDANNCGGCGVQCETGVACIAGKCGCSPGLTECDGTCIDTSTDDGNCGACNVPCSQHQPEDAGTPPPHMFYGCRNGTCSELRCQNVGYEFRADCNDNIRPDGCEVDLLKEDTENCGRCGNKCDPGQLCLSTETGLDCQCKGTKTLCPARSFSKAFCADLENDPKNCGSCGFPCPAVLNADTTCEHGRCAYQCQPGRADCNGRQSDGCEVELGKDPRNCGTCGTLCDVGQSQPCVGGRCVTQDCDAGPIR